MRSLFLSIAAVGILSSSFVSEACLGGDAEPPFENPVIVLEGRDVDQDFLDGVFRPFMELIEGHPSFAVDYETAIIRNQGNFENPRVLFSRHLHIVVPQAKFERVQRIVESPANNRVNGEDEASDVFGSKSPSRRLTPKGFVPLKGDDEESAETPGPTGTITLMSPDGIFVRDLKDGTISSDLVGMERSQFRIDRHKDIRFTAFMNSGSFIVSGSGSSRVPPVFNSLDSKSGRLEKCVIFADDSKRIDYLIGGEKPLYRHSLFFDPSVDGLPVRSECRLLSDASISVEGDIEEQSRVRGLEFAHTTVRWRKDDSDPCWWVEDASLRYAVKAVPEKQRHSISVSVAVSDIAFNLKRTDRFAEKSTVFEILTIDDVEGTR